MEDVDQFIQLVKRNTHDLFIEVLSKHPEVRNAFDAWIDMNDPELFKIQYCVKRRAKIQLCDNKVVAKWNDGAEQILSDVSGWGLSGVTVNDIQLSGDCEETVDKTIELNKSYIELIQEIHESLDMFMGKNFRAVYSQKMAYFNDMIVTKVPGVQVTATYEDSLGPSGIALHTPIGTLWWG